MATNGCVCVVVKSNKNTQVTQQITTVDATACMPQVIIQHISSISGKEKELPHQLK